MEEDSTEWKAACAHAKLTAAHPTKNSFIPPLACHFSKPAADVKVVTAGSIGRCQCLAFYNQPCVKFWHCSSPPAPLWPPTMF